MKNIFINKTYLFNFLFLFFFINKGYSQPFELYQTQNIHNQLKLNTRTGEVQQIQDDGQQFLVNVGITPENTNGNRYSLHETENIWTYILVDEFFGKLYQIQFSVQGDEYRGIWVINPNSLSYTEKRKFSIKPLTSMFQFYLINNEDGEMWKFQWSSKGDEFRWIEKLQ
jgi:hypothetical protein